MGISCSSRSSAKKDSRRRKLSKAESNDLIQSLSSFEDAITAIQLNNYTVCQVLPVFEPLLKKNKSKEINFSTSNRLITKLKILTDMHQVATDFGKKITQIDAYLVLTIMETYIAVQYLAQNRELELTQLNLEERINYLNLKFKLQRQPSESEKSLEGMIDTLIDCEIVLFPWVANIFSVSQFQGRNIIANVVASDIFNVVRDFPNQF